MPKLPMLPTATHEGHLEWCERVADYHSENHSGGVSEEERHAVEAHLAECAQCRAALASYDRLYALARSPLRLEGDADAHETDTADGEANPGRQPSHPAPLPYRPLSVLPARLVSPAATAPTRTALLAALAASLILAGFAALLLPRLRGVPETFSPSSISPYIYGLAMASADEGWAAGQGLLWHYHDGHWGYVPYPLVDSGSGATYFGQPGERQDIQLLAPDDCWSASDRFIFHYDGQNWSIVPNVPLDGNSVLRGISMSSADDGWAVGYRLTSPQSTPLALRYSHGVWTPIPVYVASSPELWSVSAVSADEAWASGYSTSDPSGQASPVLLHYTGGQWRQAAIPPGLTSLGRVTMLGPNDGWMSAYRQTTADSQPQGLLLRYRGGSWQIERELGSGAWVEQIAFVSPTEGWAAGSILLHYHDGVWTTVPLPANAAGARLNAISLVSADEGWAAGLGVMLHLHQGQWSLYGTMNPPGPQTRGPIPTPTTSPPCTMPADSTDAIQSGGLGAPFVTFPRRWGAEHLSQSGEVYLGAASSGGAPRVFTTGDGDPGVLSLVYLVAPSQYVSLDQARQLASGILPRDASLVPTPGELAPAVDGMAETYCSAALAHVLLAEQANYPHYAQPAGLFTVAYIYRSDGGIDRIVFAPAGTV